MSSSTPSSSSSSSSTSPRRRRKHSRNNKTTAPAAAARNNKMAIINEPPPSSPGSPFSWRLERRSSSENKKSHGISPAQFHTKKEDNGNGNGNANENNDNNENESSSSSSHANATTRPSLPAWKEQIERNLLIQEQKAHMKELEAKRKEFRRKTQLKTWPLQDMA